MQSLKVDVAVIGAGTAGLVAYRAARAQGARTILIEGGQYGTTCARVGCMPSKLLIAAAEASHMIDAAPGFGVHSGEKRIDGPAVMARVRNERDRFVGFVLEGVESISAEDKLRGHARFTGPHTLQVDGEDGPVATIEAARIVIATGSTPTRVPRLENVGPGVVTSDDVFYWQDLPRSVAVIGTGVIGLELGQALTRLGVRVSVYARGGSVAQLSDPVVLRNGARVMGEALDLHFQSEILKAVQDGDEVVLTTCEGGEEKTARFEHVLMAIGRTPNVFDLGIEHAGLLCGANGVPLFDSRTMQCGSSHIFIAGDNAGRYPDIRPGLRRAALTAAFTEPNIVTLGSSYKDLCAPGKPKFAIGQVSFENQGRSRVMLQNQGMLRVYGEYGTGRFLGAEMIAPRGEHLGHLLAWAVQSRMTVGEMLEMPFYHPVVEEGVRTALRDLATELAKDASKTDPAEMEPGT
jgi:dihydrolipoamide dehydrogenase